MGENNNYDFLAVLDRTAKSISNERRVIKEILFSNYYKVTEKTRDKFINYINKFVKERFGSKYDNILPSIGIELGVYKSFKDCFVIYDNNKTTKDEESEFLDEVIDNLHCRLNESKNTIDSIYDIKDYIIDHDNAEILSWRIFDGYTNKIRPLYKLGTHTFYGYGFNAKYIDEPEYLSENEVKLLKLYKEYNKVPHKRVIIDHPKLNMSTDTALNILFNKYPELKEEYSDLKI